MRIFLLLSFAVSAVLGGPLISKLIESEENDLPELSDDDLVEDVDTDTDTEKDAAAKKPADKEEDDKKKAAAAKAATTKNKKTVAEVEVKKISDQIEESSKKIEAEHKNTTKKVNPVTVGCYSAVVSNLVTLGFIILIAVVWYFGCIRHGRCCCMCCYNKAGRCCCACSCCDGYIAKEDEEMVISRGDQPEYESINVDQKQVS